MAQRVDPRQDADAYIEKHKIMDLFGELGTRLVHERPADPNAFLLSTLQAKQAGELGGFFSEANVKTMFGMFDLVGRGFLTPDQYRQALRSLGIDAPKTWPLPPKVDKVDLPLFTANVRKELGK
jgi:hypothetical protein